MWTSLWEDWGEQKARVFRRTGDINRGSANNDDEQKLGTPSKSGSSYARKEGFDTWGNVYQ